MKKNKNSKRLNKKQYLLIGLVILAIFIIFACFGGKSEDLSKNYIGQDAKDYTGQDVKMAYEELTTSDYVVEFVFNRNNNGGFSEKEFQDYIIKSIQSENYKENPYTIIKQENSGKNVILYIEFASVAESEKIQNEKEQILEQKLSSVSAMSACERYGKQIYRNFKIHSITGKIAEYASDENTWFMKYYVDANDREELSMECYVTGTDDNPKISSFTVY